MTRTWDWVCEFASIWSHIDKNTERVASGDPAIQRLRVDLNSSKHLGGAGPLGFAESLRPARSAFDAASGAEREPGGGV